jgi:cytochrome c556
MRKVVLTGVLAMAFAVLGCGGGGDNVDNTSAGTPGPSKPPIGWDDQGDHDWLHRSQFKQHMRHLWIDCNRIVSAGRGDLEPTWYEIHSAAADIKRRAEDFAGFWAEIDDAGGKVLECVEDEDRVGATREFQRLGSACDDCHMASWSPTYLHVTSEEIANWNSNKPSTPGMSIEQKDPPPAIPNRESMKTLFFHYQMAELRLKKWELADLQTELGKIRPEAAKRAERWKTVADEAGRLVEAAKKRKRDGMKDAYERMTYACLQCHTEYAGPIRDIMIPMPWNGPVK